MLDNFPPAPISIERQNDLARLCTSISRERCCFQTILSAHPNYCRFSCSFRLNFNKSIVQRREMAARMCVVKRGKKEASARLVSKVSPFDKRGKVLLFELEGTGFLDFL